MDVVRTWASRSFLRGSGSFRLHRRPVGSRPTEVKAALEVLNGYLKPLSPAIETTGCDLLIERHPGRVEEIFAGICRLKSGAQVMVRQRGPGERRLHVWPRPGREAGGTIQALADWTSAPLDLCRRAGCDWRIRVL